METLLYIVYISVSYTHLVVIDVHLHLITDVEVTDTQIIEIRNLGIVIQ